VLQVTHKRIRECGDAFSEREHRYTLHALRHVARVVRLAAIQYLRWRACARHAAEHPAHDAPLPKVLNLPEAREGRAHAELPRVRRIYPVHERAPEHARERRAEAALAERAERLVVRARGPVRARERLACERGEQRGARERPREPHERTRHAHEPRRQRAPGRGSRDGLDVDEAVRRGRGRLGRRQQRRRETEQVDLGLRRVSAAQAERGARRRRTSSSTAGEFGRSVRGPASRTTLASRPSTSRTATRLLRTQPPNLLTQRWRVPWRREEESPTSGTARRALQERMESAWRDEKRRRVQSARRPGQQHGGEASRGVLTKTWRRIAFPLQMCACTKILIAWRI
jgi:hypothetical protein